MNQLAINTKIIGRLGPLLAPLSVHLNGNCSTLRELLTCIVREQVGAFRDRQESRRLIQILTEKQISEGFEKGSFISGGEDLEQSVDVDEAIQAACSAFEDGFFYVFLGNTQLTSLEEPVELGETAEALFVRLVPLVGG